MTDPLPTPGIPTPLQANPNLWPPRDPAIQAALDTDHLRLLEIGFYISGVLTAFRFLWFLAMGVFFSVAGFAALQAAQHQHNAQAAPPPAAFFLIFAVIFGTIIFLTLIFAGLEIYAGICLKNRRHPVLIQIIAGFYCLSIPWGTALGVSTFMVLNRPSVKPLFSQS
jgi:hypothetical protein